MAVSGKSNSDVAFECDLRDAASSIPATAISLEVSGLAFFEEFLTRIDDEGENDINIDNLRLQEYVEKGKLRKISRMVKNVDGTTTARTTYSFSTTSPNAVNEGETADGIKPQDRRHGRRVNRRRRRSQQLRVSSTAA